MKNIKILNISLCFLAVTAAWFSPAQFADKCCITAFFAVVVCFWLAAGARKTNV